MKKLLLTIAFILVAQIGMAQDAAFKADVLKVIKISGSTATMDAVKKQVLAMVPEAKHAAFLVEFEATLPALYEKLAAVYMKEYTPADVKEMIKFYESPVGKKISEKAGAIYEQSTLAGQEWGQGLQTMMMKYMQ
jgi:hypothetical protein